MSRGHFKKIDLRTLAHERVEADRVLSHGDLVETETSVLVWLDHESELLKSTLEGLIRHISTAWFDHGGERVTLENGWTIPGVLEVG